MAQQAVPSPEGVFLRPSSGLVKAAGLIDVFIFNVGIISIGIGILYMQRFGPAYYGDGNMLLATLGATILMTLVALGFWTWVTAIPRSGGIYVFLTRSRTAGIGFGLSFVECTSWLFYAALAATLLVSAGLWPLAALLFGPNSATADWLGTPLAKLTIGSIAVWIAAALLIRGTKLYFAVQKTVFCLAIIGTLALIYVLASHDAPQTLIANVNSMLDVKGNDFYRDIIRQAQASGFSLATSATFGGTVTLIVWPFLPLIGAAFSLVLAGEIQNNHQNQLFGMLGSLVFAALVLMLVAYLNNRAFGTDFQGALAYLSDKDLLEKAGFRGDPYLVYLAGLSTNHIVLRILLPIGFIAWIWFWIPGVLAYTERAFLAWALDRAAPAPLGALHPMWGTPYVAVVCGASVTELFLILILYTDFFTPLVYALVGASTWCIALILGSIFPITNRHMHASSPLSQKRILGIYVMSLACGAGALSLAFIVYLLWNDEVAAGHSPKSLAVIAATFALGFAFYLAVNAWRKRQGIDISRAFKEIPVE